MKVDTLGRRSESFPLQTWQERKVPYDECAVGVRRLRAPGVGGGRKEGKGGYGGALPCSKDLLGSFSLGLLGSSSGRISEAH